MFAVSGEEASDCNKDTDHEKLDEAGMCLRVAGATESVAQNLAVLSDKCLVLLFLFCFSGWGDLKRWGGVSKVTYNGQ